MEVEVKEEGYTRRHGGGINRFRYIPEGPNPSTLACNSKLSVALPSSYEDELTFGHFSPQLQYFLFFFGRFLFVLSVC